MSDADVFRQVTSIMSDVFDIDDDEITEQTSAADIEEWDSLSHIRLVISIERHFKFKFTSEEIASMLNVGDLVKTIVQKLG